MKKEMSPAVVGVIIAVVVVIAGFFVWRGMQPQDYPGLNAEKPMAEPGNYYTTPDGKKVLSGTVNTKKIKSPEQAAGRIPGAGIPMGGMQGGGGQQPGGGQTTNPGGQ